MAKHKLNSMAMSKTESKKEFGLSPDEDKGPKFPHGLMVHLNDDSLKKLGMDTMPEVGKTMSLLAVVKVTGVSQSESQGAKARRHVDLQITELIVSKEPDPGDAADKIYDGKRAG